MMKRKFLILFVSSALLFSCSKDKIAADLVDELGGELEGDKSGELVGIWRATELKIDNSTATDQAKFGKQILDFLTAKQCYVVTFDFKADLSVVSKNSVNYLEVNVGGSGLDIPCPSQEDTDTGTFSFDGEILTYVDSNDETVLLDVTVADGVLSIDAAQLDIPNFNASGELVFNKM